MTFPQNNLSLNPGGMMGADHPFPGGGVDAVYRAPSGWCDVMLLGVACGLSAAIYGRTAAALSEIWTSDPNYSHGFLVPLCSAVFAAMAWQRHGTPLRGVSSAAVPGVGKILLGLGLHGLAVLLGNLLLDVLSLVVVLRGCVLLAGGRSAHRDFGFAALFLVFMAPLPTAWYQPTAVMLQQAVSLVSSETLDLLGATVYREGHTVFLPGCAVQVGEACSGIRGLVAIVALAVALGHFLGRSAWYRWGLALLAVPIATLANCVRVVLTGVIVMCFGRRWGDGLFHVLEGLVVGGGSVAVLVALAFRLARGQDRRVLPPRHPSGGPAAGRRLIAGCVVLGMGLVGGEAWRWHLEAAGPPLAVPLARPLAELPLALGDWQGVDEPVRGTQGNGGNERLERTYSRPGRSAVRLWLVYTGDGSDRSHHPEVCMRVAGKPEDVAARRRVAVDGHPAAVQQFCFKTPGARQWVFYWHYTLPHRSGAAGLMQRIYQSACRRPASVTMEVVVRESAPEDVQSAEEFVQLLDRAIQAHVGPAALRGSDCQPIDG